MPSACCAGFLLTIPLASTRSMSGVFLGGLFSCSRYWRYWVIIRLLLGCNQLIILHNPSKSLVKTRSIEVAPKAMFGYPRFVSHEELLQEEAECERRRQEFRCRLFRAGHRREHKEKPKVPSKWRRARKIWKRRKAKIRNRKARKAANACDRKDKVSGDECEDGDVSVSVDEYHYSEDGDVDKEHHSEDSDVDKEHHSEDSDVGQEHHSEDADVTDVSTGEDADVGAKEVSASYRGETQVPLVEGPLVPAQVSSSSSQVPVVHQPVVKEASASYRGETQVPLVEGPLVPAQVSSSSSHVPVVHEPVMVPARKMVPRSIPARQKVLRFIPARKMVPRSIP